MSEITEEEPSSQVFGKNVVRDVVNNRLKQLLLFAKLLDNMSSVKDVTELLPQRFVAVHLHVFYVEDHETQLNRVNIERCNDQSRASTQECLNVGGDVLRFKARLLLSKVECRVILVIDECQARPLARGIFV